MSSWTFTGIFTSLLGTMSTEKNCGSNTRNTCLDFGARDAYREFSLAVDLVPMIFPKRKKITRKDQAGGKKMFPNKRQIEQSLKRNGFSANDAKKYVALWDSKGFLDSSNWDEDDNFLPDMKEMTTAISDRVASLLRRTDIFLH
jgi:hypothetical protein